MLAEFHGVQVSAQDAGRSHDGNAFRIERVHQVADGVDTLADDGFVLCFVEAYGHRFDFTNRNTAVGKEAFEQRNHSFHFIVKFPAVGADAAAARGAEFAGREVNQIGQSGHCLDDVGHRILFPVLFALLDQVSVFTQQTGVEYQHQVVFVRDAAHVHQVGHREGLAADQVGRGFHADERNVLHACFGDEFFKFFNVHIALEGVVGVQFETCVGDQLHDFTAVLLDVSQSRGEVVVHGHRLTGLDESTRNDVLRSASLVDGQQVFLTQYVFHSFLQTHERLRTRIGVVGAEHRRELVVAHGIGTAVG